MELFSRSIWKQPVLGYCDLDLVFDNLSSMLDIGRLDEADFFSADAGPVVGTFCLYRNSDRMNTFAQRIPGYLSKLNSAEYESLDEIELAKALSNAPDIRYMRPTRLAESQLSISAQGRMIGRTAGVEGDPKAFYWSDGRTFVKSRDRQPQEVMYLHFIGLKRSYHWKEYDPARKYMEFSFSSAGFQPWKSPPTRAVAVPIRAPWTYTSIPWQSSRRDGEIFFDGLSSPSEIPVSQN